MPNPDGSKIVLPLQSGTTGLQTGPEGGDLAMDSADSREIKVNQSGTVRTLVTNTGTQTLTNKTITGAVSTVATESITAASDAWTVALDSGSVKFLNRAAGSAIALPAPSAGATVRMIVGTAPTGGTGYVITSNAANEIVGGVGTTDVNSATDPDFEAAGANTITFVNDKAVVGDWVELTSNGTLWYARGHCSVFDAITFTDV